MPGEDAQLALRPRGRRRLVGARVDPHRGVAAGAQGAQLGQLRPSGSAAWPGRLVDGLHPRLERLDALVDLLVELLGAVLDRRIGKGVGEVLGRDGARALRGHHDEVALRERLRLHVLQQRARAAVGLQLLLRGPRATSIVVTRLAAVETSRVGSLDAVIGLRVASVALSRGTGRDEQGRARLVGLLGGAHVQHGSQRRDEHRQDDQLEPLADRLDVAAQSLLLA